ncbi:uncharacterized protein BDZ99DRAFT_127408 [Mytilinidion resinicola]|uniref:SRR1-like domain-containing protein n=1 Tax=Mytilinidion resinicola TaxID=574789 RepID=A0A6A6Z5U2_9PEZI|nr:uncharacterized protein BDZ99DRAFT_127408 [Mytilinidion resinicola]KAF2816033.1 hypothetical protein BDZ99DRAFT_127408 [Mytilinidion resinicola]
MDELIAPEECTSIIHLPALLEDLSAFKEEWLASPFSTRLSSLLLARSEGWGVDRAVLIGLGNMTPDARECDEDEDEYRLRHKGRLIQLMIFIEIVNILSTAQSARPIEMYASDPTFQHIDEALLGKLNIKIFKKGEELVTSSTFVYSPFAPWPAGVDAIRHSPELYLGVSWKGTTELYSLQSSYGFEMTDEQFAIMENFLQTRLMYSFPGLESFPDSQFEKCDPELVELALEGFWGAFRFYWPKPVLPARRKTRR